MPDPRLENVPEPPILPYRAGGRDRFESSRDEVFGTTGKFALVLSGIAVVYVTGGILLPRFVDRIDSDALRYGPFCCGGLSWIVSLTMAISVAIRDSIGRKWGITALVVDAIVVPAIVFVFYK
jgi:hypothetical protein